MLKVLPRKVIVVMMAVLVFVSMEMPALASSVTGSQYFGHWVLWDMGTPFYTNYFEHGEVQYNGSTVTYVNFAGAEIGAANLPFSYYVTIDSYGIQIFGSGTLQSTFYQSDLSSYDVIISPDDISWWGGEAWRNIGNCPVGDSSASSNTLWYCPEALYDPVRNDTLSLGW